MTKMYGYVDIDSAMGHLQLLFLNTFFLCLFNTFHASSLCTSVSMSFTSTMFTMLLYLEG